MPSFALRVALTAFGISVAGAGCSSLLGLDDYTDAETGASSSSGGTTTTAVGPGSSGSTSDGASTSGSSTSTSTTSDGGGGNASTSDGGGGNATTSDGGGGNATTSDGGGGNATTSDGGGGNATTSDGGGGSTSSDGGGGGVVDPGPTVVIISASVAEGQTTNTSRATFLFGSIPAGSAQSFECDLDDSGTFSDCTPGGFDRFLLSGGAHELQVRGRNSGGTVGPILRRNWIVEALGTNIPNLRAGSVPEQTLVTISTNVRSTVMLTFDAVQNIFVQDQNGNTVVAARNHGIRTFARNAEPTMNAGLALTITGTYQVVDGSAVINAADYIRGAQLSPYAPLNSNETDVLDAENIESAVINLAAEIPTDFDCSSCDNPTQGNCLNGCSACNPLPYRDFVNSQPPGYEYGSYTGVMVGDVVREFWYVESQEQGDDICL